MRRKQIGAAQTAYQIVVKDAADQVVWDSGSMGTFLFDPFCNENGSRRNVPIDPFSICYFFAILI